MKPTDMVIQITKHYICLPITCGKGLNYLKNTKKPDSFFSQVDWVVGLSRRAAEPVIFTNF